MYTLQETVEYDGLTWHRYPNALRRSDREYFCRGNRTLHRYVWEKYNGKVPKGYAVHHKDGNCQNNDISNLECISVSEHMKERHKPSPERVEQLRKNLDENARPKAIEWHKSEQAKEFHKKLGKMSWENFEPVLKKCEICGKEFYDNSRQQTGKYCSGACGAKAARKVMTTKICEWCGKEFETNKYYPAKFCSRSCRGHAGHVTRKTK